MIINFPKNVTHLCRVCYVQHKYTLKDYLHHLPMFSCDICSNILLDCTNNTVALWVDKEIAVRGRSKKLHTVDVFICN